MITDQKWVQKTNIDSARSIEPDQRHFLFDYYLTNWLDDRVTFDWEQGLARLIDKTEWRACAWLIYPRLRQ